MKEHILVTGSNRSGSTWVGQVLSQAPKLRYTHEPFSPEIAEKEFGWNLPRWFLNAEDWDEKKLSRYIKRVLCPPLVDSKLKLDFPTKIKRAVRIAAERGFPESFAPRHLFKDPVAIFSAPWLAKKFNFEVVVLIRHPASYVLSLLKDASHMHSFARIFGEQPKLTDRYESEEKKLIHKIIEIQTKKGIGSEMVFEASAFWRLFYSQVLQYKSSYPNWNYIFYENLAENPIDGFQALFKTLGLEYTDKVLQKIACTSLEKDPTKIDLKSHVKRFNSKDNTMQWDKNINQEDKILIRQITGSVSSAFYPDFK